jgi:hypothetical protein
VTSLPDLGHIAHGSLSGEEVAAYEGALARHYGEPVRPVSRYCKAFETWARALDERKERVEALSDDDPRKQPETNDALTKIADLSFLIALSIRKSNLLYRLIYEDQPLRTEMCPEHQGRWSGCVWDEYCECMDGYDVTGWLPNHRLSTAELLSRFAKARGGFATWSIHLPASPDYDEDEPTVATALGKKARGRDVAEAARRLASALREDGFVAEEWQP